DGVLASGRIPLAFGDGLNKKNGRGDVPRPSGRSAGRLGSARIYLFSPSFLLCLWFCHPASSVGIAGRAVWPAAWLSFGTWSPARRLRRHGLVARVAGTAPSAFSRDRFVP